MPERAARSAPPRTAPRIALLAVLAAAAVAVAGCGGTAGRADPAAAGAGGGASASSYPTQDVVSPVTADAAARAKLPAAVRTAGRLTLGTPLTPGTAGLPHSGQAPGGARIGLDVDLRNAVAKKLGISWTIEDGTFATIIPGVQNGKFDVGQGNFGVTKAREKVVDFATYLSDGQAFLAAKDVPLSRVTSLTDLCGLTVATSPGSTFQQILTDGAGKCAGAGKKPYEVKYFADSGPIFLGLGNGKIDVYFGPTLSLKYDAQHVPDTKFLSQISATPVGFVTANGSPVAKALSAAINDLIHDGTYAKIFAKWGVPGSGIKKSEVNPAATL